MSARVPRWKQVGYSKSPPREHSARSKSSRYTPKKDHHASDEELDGFRFIAHDMSSHNISEHNVLQQSKASPKSAVNYGNYVSSDGKSERNQRGGGFDSISQSKEKSSKPKHSFNTKQEKRITELPDLENIRIGDNVESQFKQYLMFIQKVEHKFHEDKAKVEAMLNEQYEHIRNIKSKIVETFSGRESEIQDKTLRKVIQNQQNERNKISNIKLSLNKHQSERPDPIRERENIMFRNQETSKSPKGKREKSTGSWAVNKFQLIFEALNQMKLNLNDCKKLRESRSTSKQRFMSPTKTNLVDTNTLRVKSKKTHE